MKDKKRANRLLIGITGTPGVGKTHFSKELGRKLESLGIPPVTIEINDIVLKKHAYNGTDEFGSKIIVERTLREEIKKGVGNAGVTIVVGHLLPETGLRPDICIALRQDLKTLASRLSKRHYPPAKIRENLLSEAYDDVGTRVKGRCSEFYEVGKEEQRQRAIQYICDKASGAKAIKPKNVEIDKFGELKELIIKGNRFGF